MTTRNFDSTNPESIETAAHDVIVTAYAVAHVIEGLLWEKRQTFDFQNPALEAEQERISARITALRELYRTRYGWKCLSRWLHGNPNDSDGADVSNYDVEDDVKAALGTDGISYDSESGWFVIHMTPTREAEVVAYLREHHPYMDFEVDDEEDVSVGPPMVTSWTSSQHWLAERGFVVSYTAPEPTPVTGKPLIAILDEAEAVLERTGMSLEDATALLVGRKNRTV